MEPVDELPVDETPKVFELEVEKAQRTRDLTDNSDFMEVHFFIKDQDGEVHGEFKQAFPLSISKTELEEELTKALATFDNDSKLAAENKERTEAEEAADEVATEVTGRVIKLDLKEGLGIKDNVK